MSKKQYINKGICIWCLKSKPEVNFSHKPHTIPRKLNNVNIGFDICNDCNHFFGTDDKINIVPYCLDKITKEFFNIHKFLLTPNKDSNSWKHLNSQFFDYYCKSQKLKLRVDYIRNPSYAKEFTRKFKRGIYNIFLQEYHLKTQNGLDPKFDTIRNFVRYNIGDIPLFYLVSSNGIRFCEDLEKPLELYFNAHTDNIIEKYGFYSLIFTGLHFYLAVNEKYLQNFDYILNESKNLIGSGFIFKELIELKKITEIDFTLQKWNK